MATRVATSAAVRQLAEIFHRNGYIRVPNLDRRAATPGVYKKGYEVRLVANSASELREIRRLLKAAGFEPGRAYPQAKRWRQPLYGREAVTRFLEGIQRAGPRKADVAADLNAIRAC